ncbi:hypothetical protein Q3H58_002860 [Pseudomonas psychrotolerans]|nr:hypothetical protein [Pseudomonas psychrotolerans]
MPNPDDARHLAAFTGNQTTLVFLDGLGEALLHDGEFGTRACLQGRHLDLVPVIAHRLAKATVQHHFVIVVEDGEVLVVLDLQLHRLVEVAVRHFQLVDDQLLATPGKAVQAQQGRGDVGVVLRLETTGDEVADDREVARLDDDIQLEIFDRLADHRARLEQLDLGHRFGHGRRHARGLISQAGHALLFHFDLDHGVRRIHRRRQDGIADTERSEDTDDRQ